MSTNMTALRLGALTAVLVTAASASAQEIKIEKIRANITWYTCKTGEKRTDAPTWTPRSGQVRSDGFVEVLDESGKPSTYCVKPFAVVTEQKIPVKQECGTVVAQRTGATRGLGEDCPDATAKGK
jgi:hypothetical protein